MAAKSGKKPANDVRVSVLTGNVVLSFPKVFFATAETNKDGDKEYTSQILVPKTDKKTVQALLSAIKEVGEAKFGASWKAANIRKPLRDGDAEADMLCEDGETTRGEKYPERNGHYFFNVKTKRKVPIFDRQKNEIDDPSEIYGGVIARVAVTMYPYNVSGNMGIGVALDGIQKVKDGEAFGGGGEGGTASVANMFEILDEEDDDDIDVDGYDEDEDEDEAPAKPARKAPAKKAPRKKAPVVVEDDEDDEDDLYGDDSDI